MKADISGRSRDVLQHAVDVWAKRDQDRVTPYERVPDSALKAAISILIESGWLEFTCYAVGVDKDMGCELRPPRADETGRPLDSCDRCFKVVLSTSRMLAEYTCPEEFREEYKRDNDGAESEQLLVCPECYAEWDA
jgi:hypothetical protein